ncbi:YlbF family regulator [Staphylococcus sp. 17KM0847]|uniref:YlbF family regulator n=1 Tax=Staphylococcus sp. 17KM0847 TaxID=2583989 RepID=UPI0015DBDE01|nr:YlbF family regulator [Staphylococcus sp. 17KM0847]QLK85908.1 hypothetical protein FGL66_03875 [Staphylococcus sp. 17KM0847]
MSTREDVLQAARALQTSIQNLETIQHYRQVEAQIHQNEHIATQMQSLKQQQKQSVNLQNYNKPIAYERSEEAIQSIQTQIDDIPIVSEFRQAQAQANDTLHFMIETLAEGVGLQIDDTNE